MAVIIGNGDYRKQSKDIRDGNVIFLKDATGSQLARVFGSEKNHRGQLFD